LVIGGAVVTVVVIVTSTRRAPARRKSAVRKKPARRHKPSLLKRLRTSLAAHLGRQADDIWGVILALVGVLAALAIYADVVGPAGHQLRRGADLSFGWARLLLPVAFAGVGATLLQGRARHEPARAAIGFAFLLVATSGLSE